jgi:hypothetical protein
MKLSKRAVIISLSLVILSFVMVYCGKNAMDYLKTGLMDSEQIEYISKNFESIPIGDVLTIINPDGSTSKTQEFKLVSKLGKLAPVVIDPIDDPNVPLNEPGKRNCTCTASGCEDGCGPNGCSPVIREGTCDCTDLSCCGSSTGTCTKTESVEMAAIR